MHNESMLESADVFICAHSQFRGLFMALAEQLHRHRRCRLHLFVATEQEREYYQRHESAALFEQITKGELLYQFLEDAVPEHVVRQATEIEKSLGVTFNTIRMSDRHLGREFALIGSRHPRSRQSEAFSYQQILGAYVRQTNWWREQIQTHKPSLVIYPSKLLEAICRASQIPVRYICSARHKNYYYWSPDSLFSSEAIRQAYAASLPQPPEESGASAVQPYKSHTDTRTAFLRSNSFLGMLKSIGLYTLRHISWKLRGFEKARGYYLSDTVALYYNTWRDTRFLTSRKHTIAAADLDRHDYILYPLQTEPEYAVQGLSPEYFFQLEIIAALSRMLPANAKLAVKETFWAVGRRPTGFYRQLQEFRNVIFIDMLATGPEAIRGSLGVVTITGTAAFEATTLSKPAAVLGRHNFFGAHEFIFEAGSSADLEPIVARMVAEKIAPKDINRESQRMIAAIRQTGFDLEDYNVLKPDKVSEAAAAAGYDALMVGLRPMNRRTSGAQSAPTVEAVSAE